MDIRKLLFSGAILQGSRWRGKMCATLHVEMSFCLYLLETQRSHFAYACWSLEPGYISSFMYMSFAAAIITPISCSAAGSSSDHVLLRGCYCGPCMVVMPHSVCRPFGFTGFLNHRTFGLLSFQLEICSTHRPVGFLSCTAYFGMFFPVLSGRPSYGHFMGPFFRASVLSDRFECSTSDSTNDATLH